MLHQEMIYFSGVNGDTGQYFRQPLSLEAVRRLARGREVEPDELRRPLEGVEAGDLSSAGWAALIPEGFDKECEKALKDLFEHRRRQAGSLFRTIRVKSDRTPQAGNKIQFLDDLDTGAGPVDPQKLPYYLLIVGSPTQIPYRLQFQLGVQHAVGRICFENSRQYSSYANNVLQSESGQIRKGRQLTLFGPRHDHGEDPTELSIRHLIDPLSKKLRNAPEEGWQVQTLKAAEATKASLSRQMGNGETPALLLTAGHALCYPRESEHQEAYQGALICQDWAGPGKDGPSDFFFSARDLGDEADLSGLVAFHFACFSAGTPLYNSFSSPAPGEREEIACQPFVARLPQRMLSLKRGALAVIGHVDTAYWHSFQWKKAGQQIQTFEATVRALMKGKRVGQALSYFGERYADLAADLFDDRLEKELAGQDPNEVDPYLWTAIRDARSYIALGDPAVRIPLR